MCVRVCVHNFLQLEQKEMSAHPESLLWHHWLPSLIRWIIWIAACFLSSSRTEGLREKWPRDSIRIQEPSMAPSCHPNEIWANLDSASRFAFVAIYLQLGSIPHFSLRTLPQLRSGLGIKTKNTFSVFSVCVTYCQTDKEWPTPLLH